MMKSQHGNVLFLILIAVALFAALAIAITQSLRTQNGSPDTEISSMTAASNMQIGAQMEQAITRMKITNGCADSQISFNNHNGTSIMTDGASYNYFNPNSPPNGSCDIFSPNGGNIPAPILVKEGTIPPSSVACPGCLQSQSWFVSAMRVMHDGTDVGAAGTDLVLWLGRVNRAQCLQVNKSLGISNPGGEPPADTFDCADNPFNGTYPACADPIGDTATELRGKREFCVHWGTAWGIEGYLHMYVLIAR